MKHLEEQPSAWLRVAGVIARCVVGGVLAYAGFSKLTRPVAEFIAVIDAYQLIPTSSAIELAGILPWIELYTGVLLIFGYWTQRAAQAAIGLFGTFLLVLTVSLVRGIHPDSCGCFGAAIHLTPMQGIGVDALLLGLSFVILKRFTPAWTLESWFERSSVRMGSGRSSAPKTNAQTARG